mmetsp:Transcript_8183/g.18297  ORF Transcript_8183/g.18297 Transcript_8183/m.18297 type:complete len:448 (+) Transcript_8183:49-1392(+)
MCQARSAHVSLLASLHVSNEQESELVGRRNRLATSYRSSGFTSDRHAHIEVRILDASGAEETRSQRSSDLVDEWPESERAQALRALHLLNENREHDFLLRHTWQVTLVRTPFVRAIVEASRVIFLRADNLVCQAFLEELRPLIRRGQGDFRHLVLEALVCATVTLASMRWQMLQPVVDYMLRDLRLDDHDSILKLYPVRIAVQTFIKRMKPLVDRLHQPLMPTNKKVSRRADEDNSDDTEEQGVLKGSSFSSAYLPACGSFVLLPSMEVALSMNDWGHSTHQLLTDAEETNQRIDDALRFLEASMSCARNRLLFFELWTDIFTVALGAGALVSGIFGMNLTSGLEQREGAFGGVLMGMVVGGLILVGILLLAVVRSKRYYELNRTRYGNNKFFSSISDDSYVLSFNSPEEVASSPRSTLSTGTFERILGELRKPANESVLSSRASRA